MTASTRTGAIDVTMPQLGETVAEGTVIQWLKRVGDTVVEGEPLFEVGTDKVDTEVPAVATGVLVEILVSADDTVLIGTRLAVIEVGGTTRQHDEPASAPASSPRPDLPPPPALVPPRAAVGERPLPAPHGARHVASPRMRRLLREHGLDEWAATGTGVDGRLTRADVDAVLAPSDAVVQPAAADILVQPAAADILVQPAAADVVVVQPSVAFCAVEVDFQLVATTIARYDASAGQSGGPVLGYESFVVRAAVEAIGHVPELHLRANPGGSGSRGLDVLLGDGTVIRGVADKRLSALAREMSATGAESSGAAADLILEVRYPGTHGTVLSRPASNGRTPALLTLDAVRPVPVAVPISDGYALAVRPVGNVGLTYDPAVIPDDASGRFLGRVKYLLENVDWRDEL